MQTNRDIFNKKRIEIYLPSPDNYFFKLGRANYSKAHPPLKQHIHENMMEIVFIEKGKQIYSVGNNEYTVNSNEVFLTFPNEPHSTAIYPEDKSIIYFIIIDLEKLKTGFIGCDAKEGEIIVQSILNIKSRVLKATAELKTILDKIITTYYSDCPFKNTVIRNQISSFIINIVEHEKADITSYNSDMQKVLDFIEQNIYDNISLDILSNIAGLSIARFKANFRKQVGFPPHEFILRRKIETAKTMLKTYDMTITELAHKLSFSSSQYFSTVFKRFTLMSPIEYRNLVDTKKSN
jgi:AraC-like DNA-binding protein